MNSAFQKIISQLNGDIHAKHRDDTPLFTSLTAAQNDLGLLFDTRPTCPFLRPHFLSRTQYSEISHAARLIAQAFEKLADAALENAEVLSVLDLTEEEERMARIHPGYTRLCVTSRLDTFVDGNDFKFLEYNAETPAGVGDQMQLERVLGNIPLIKDFFAENIHWKPQPHRKLLESLVKTYREFGGRKSKPNIAIVDWEGVSTESEFYSLTDYFEGMGYQTLIVDPNELEYNGKNLHAGSFEIDIFYKRLIIHEYLTSFDKSHALARAYGDGNVFMANSFRVKLAHKKAGFAILSDEKYKDIFTADELEAIRKHIPWTRKVSEAKTTYRDATIDLIKFLGENRERFLLKPNDDYGGKGIVMGWEKSSGEWEKALIDAQKTSFIVQERANIHKEYFPTYAETLSLEELLVDFDPFLFLNEVEGGMVRLSSSSLVNVTQGGGQTALIVLENF